MKTLIVQVTKSYPTNFEPIIDSFEKRFTGKTADKDCQIYLEQLHFEKMNRACINAGIGSYTLGKITKSHGNWSAARIKPKLYRDVEKQIGYSLSVKIHTLLN
jgi:hypothetical protein